jgi:agmatine deiminase
MEEIMNLKFRKKWIAILVFGITLIVNTACQALNPDSNSSDIASTSNRDTASTRLPGEWEEQASVWMQWPNDWESSLRPSFVKIIGVVQQYETVNLFVRNQAMKTSVIQILQDQNVPLTNVNFHLADYDNAWLRDNGPVYVFDKISIWVLDFGFNGWGSGAFGDVEYSNDDKIPQIMSSLVGSEYENNNTYVLERGNLEANGEDIVFLNWDCQNDRNPGWSKERTEAYFKEKFGISKVIWMEGHDPEDVTTGHIDGTVRFVDETTVVIAQVVDPSNESYSGEAAELDKAATDAKAAGLTVERFPIPGTITYNGSMLAVMYMNYLVGNGFVLGMAFGNDQWDSDAKVKLESLYPTRIVHMVEVNALWNSGGGVHCVTNDEPLFQ